MSFRASPRRNTYSPIERDSRTATNPHLPKPTKTSPRAPALNIPTTLIFRRCRREHPVLLSRASYPPIERDSRTLQQIRTSQTNQNFPTRPPPSTKANQIFARVMAGVLWGSSGRVREDWRVGRPLRKGSPCASKVFPYLTPASPPRAPVPARYSRHSEQSGCEQPCR